MLGIRGLNAPPSRLTRETAVPSFFTKGTTRPFEVLLPCWPLANRENRKNNSKIPFQGQKDRDSSQTLLPAGPQKEFPWDDSRGLWKNRGETYSSELFKPNFQRKLCRPVVFEFFEAVGRAGGSNENTGNELEKGERQGWKSFARARRTDKNDTAERISRLTEDNKTTIIWLSRGVSLVG